MKTSFTLANCAVSLLLATSLATGHAAPKTTSSTTSKLPYSYYVTGNASAVVTAVPAPTPSFVLMGGGPDVDEAFRWMVSRAGIKPGTGGRVVIIRATGTEAYNPYIYYSNAALSTSASAEDQWVGGAAMGVTSVETLVIPSVTAANHRDVIAIVAGASAVFIAGGDQSDYIRYWKGTALQNTLQGLMDKKIPIGGTSAGLAVLGQFDFAALNGSVTSTQALSNPYNKYMSLDPSPLSLTGGFLSPAALASTILDSHVDERDRMGRLITFVSRLVAPVSNAGCAGGILAAGTSGLQTARGIGLGVETALLVYGDEGTNMYRARRVTNISTTTPSAVYFVRPSTAPSTCVSGKPLTAYTVEIQKLSDSDTTFNLSTWSGLTPHHVDVVSGALTASPY